MINEEGNALQRSMVCLGVRLICLGARLTIKVSFAPETNLTPSSPPINISLPQEVGFLVDFFPPDLVLPHCKCINNYIHKIRFCVLFFFVYLCFYLHLFYEFSI